MKMLQNIGLCKVLLAKTPKSQEITVKVDMCDYIKVKKLLHSRGNNQQVQI
jgi:hypothetical protein